MWKSRKDRKFYFHRIYDIRIMGPVKEKSKITNVLVGIVEGRDKLNFFLILDPSKF